jgi:hypothetical protein
MIRSDQVELNESHATENMALLQAHRYALTEKHYMRSATRRMEQTGEIKNEGCNAIFRRAA